MTHYVLARRTRLWAPLAAALTIGITLWGLEAVPAAQSVTSPRGLAAAKGHPRRNLDLTSAALAGRSTPRAGDTAMSSSSSAGVRVKADTTATSSATCDTCEAHAQTLHIVHLNHARHATLDNVATAWSRCSKCRATALSVQVVLIRDRSADLRARNRALAVNVSCTHCRTTAEAFQFVVTGAPPGPIDPALREKLRAWFERQAEALRSEASGPTSGRRTTNDLSRVGKDTARRALRHLGHIVQGGLGGVAVRRDATVHRR